MGPLGSVLADSSKQLGNLGCVSINLPEPRVTICLPPPVATPTMVEHTWIVIFPRTGLLLPAQGKQKKGVFFNGPRNWYPSIRTELSTVLNKKNTHAQWSSWLLFAPLSVGPMNKKQVQKSNPIDIHILGNILATQSP